MGGEGAGAVEPIKPALAGGLPVAPGRRASAAFDLQTRCKHGWFGKMVKNSKKYGFHGERGGTRTLDPMIKSHVLYHLSYALT